MSPPMAKPQRPAPRYKNLTWQQLRSFCETSRLGSLAAAAAALDLTQPTVWAQVHALERHFGVALVKAHARGCQLTPAGRVLAELAHPAVRSIFELKVRLQERLGQAERHLTVATTPRIMTEDLAECLLPFEEQNPAVRIILKEMRTDEVAAAVEAGAAELGFTLLRPRGHGSPDLIYEACYELDLLLLTPANHPLARKRHVRPADLLAYPFVNSRDNATGDPVAAAALEKLGVFDRHIGRAEAFFVSSIRRLVEMGFGIALVSGRPNLTNPGRLHERVMSRHFGRTPVYIVTGRTLEVDPACRNLIRMVQERMARNPSPGSTETAP
jgi:DNA-binding transcriptional LysR family regulator